MPDINKLLKPQKHLFCIVFLLIATTPLFLFTDLDKAVSRFFYLGNGEWYGNESWVFRFFYFFGPLPNILLFMFFLYRWLFSYIRPVKKSDIVRAKFVLLSIIVGPGIVINGLLKPYYNRVRPYSIQEFGGKFQESTFLIPSGVGNSFPSGHVSVGFIFLVLFYLFYYKQPKQAYYGLSFACVLGGILGMTRISQGGHFLSDVLWAYAITHSIILVIYTLILQNNETDYQKVYPQVTTKKLIIIYSSFLFIASVVTLLFIRSLF